MGLLQKGTPLPQAFHVHQDGFRVRIFAEKFQVLVKLDVGFVAHTHIVTETFVAFHCCFGDQRQCHVAALGQQGNVAFGCIANADQVHVFMQVDHPGGVRSHQADPMFAGDLQHLFFQFAAIAAGFAKAAGQDDGALDFFSAAVFQYGRDGSGRCGNQSQVHRVFDIGDPGIALESQDAAFFRIDRVYFAAVFILQQCVDGLIPAFGDILGGADDGDRPGL